LWLIGGEIGARYRRPTDAESVGDMIADLSGVEDVGSIGGNPTEGLCEL
jgi:hypothetical protein